MKLDDIAIGSILAIGAWMAYKKFSAKSKATAVQQVVQGAITGKLEVHYTAPCPKGYSDYKGSELPSSRSSKICTKNFLGY